MKGLLIILNLNGTYTLDKNYKWNVTAKSLLIKGIEFNINTLNVSINGGDIWRRENLNEYYHIYIKVILKPGEERRIGIKIGLNVYQYYLKIYLALYRHWHYFR